MSKEAASMIHRRIELRSAPHAATGSSGVPLEPLPSGSVSDGLSLTLTLLVHFVYLSHSRLT